MDQQSLTLIAAIISAIGSITTLLLNSRLTLDREQRLVLWRKEVDRLIELEELAGRLVEDVGSYRSIDAIQDQLASQFQQFDAMAGRLARYPQVRQAVRDLNNVLGRLFVDRRDSQDDRETRQELEPAYRALLDACDSVLGKRSL
jgi:hypothetical protein